ncbi:LAFE_0D05974g1_1 [Lachancea fermentati]|uniref:Mediator of RNA polymerase II transcription subunit 22 n=1 Tax=Lachancea fermentati TaxID=4955 RepID=A0A1G4MB74_LACFM|nr:LAFE_0D05974g1_1 [Lachancea fermentati]
MSNRALLEQLDRTTEMLSNSLTQLVKYSSILSEEESGAAQREMADSIASVSSEGVAMINTQTMQLIKGIQDLLVMTRSIREKWLLSQVPEKKESEQQEVDYEKCSQMLNSWVNQIVGNSDC